MTLKEEYKIEIKNIINILGRANLFYKDSSYLSKPKSDVERRMINKSGVLHEIRYSLWVLTVLELCKLYDDNNNHCFNFYKFVRKVKQDRNKSLFKDKLRLKTLENWENKLQNLKTSDTIIKLKDLRDKYYAHSDRTPELLPEEITPNKQSIEKLIRTGQEIIFDFQNEVFDIHQNFKIPMRAGKILDCLIELNDYREKHE